MNDKEQNERMREWFRKRTSIQSDLLSDHMLEIDHLLEGRANVRVDEQVSQPGADGGGGPKDLGRVNFWTERGEYINCDALFHSYYVAYVHGADLDKLKDQMITQLLDIKKMLTEQLIDAEQRAMPKNWVGGNL